MGIFERVLQERHPASETITLTPRQAFAAVVVGACNADGRVSPEESARLNEVFKSTALFREASPEDVQAALQLVVQLCAAHGTAPVMAAAANALPAELRQPVFALATDLVLADGQAGPEERAFVDGLQQLLQVPDQDALRIVDVLVLKNSA